MECPYCKKEMEKGFIFGGNHIRWYPEGADTMLMFPEEEGAVRLNGTGGLVTSAKAESGYCADCRVVITPIPEIEDTMDKLKKKWDAFTQRVGEESEKRQTEREAEKHQKKREKQRKKDPWEV
ncbi:MAG: hypothetical protein E7469_04535 [Ruminococcaceae bacterium]|nr:hypothetical protein [Oscillospiraceae bacterium]